MNIHDYLVRHSSLGENEEWPRIQALPVGILDSYPVQLHFFNPRNLTIWVGIFSNAKVKCGT